MKVGDYVRNENGLVGKIIGFKGDMVETDNKRLITYKSNHSECKIKEKPIDLIEVGDYVNGNKIVHIQEEEFPNYPKRLLFAGVDENNIDDVWEVYNNEDIKSIVTKEQFESMEYKVGV